MNCVTTSNKKLPVRESEIRSSLLQYLGANIQIDARIQEEFRIERGGARIDVAVIGSTLIGYEIKSDEDSFIRFSNQIHAYNRVFDAITLVCGPSHAQLAQEIIPSWWGLLVAERNSQGEIQLITARHATPNTRQDPFSLASLLWRDEAIVVLTSEIKEIPKQASAHTLWSCIATSLPVDRIRSKVATTLLKRQHYNKLVVKTM